jgi:carboxyl-terminal processing protease
MALLLLFAAALQARADDASTLDRAVTLVERQLGDQIDDDALYRAALDGMTAYLDRRLGTTGNAVLTAEAAEREAIAERGERVGIGVEFAVVPLRGLVLTDVFPGGPGQRAGLAQGDFIVGLNGRPLTGLDQSAMLDLVAQATTAKVALDVRRQGADLRRIQVDRQRHKVSGAWQVPGSGSLTPTVRIAQLGTGTAEALRKVIAGLGEAKGLILDLRGTYSGMLEEAVAVAGAFLPSGSLVVQKMLPDGLAHPLYTGVTPAWSGPVLILADRVTAGPAEALVMALLDHRRARMVGTATAGRAAITSLHPLGNDLVLRLADTALRGPSGRSWSGSGIQPDVRVEPVESSFMPSPGLIPPDLQRDIAIQLLSAPSQTGR